MCDDIAGPQHRHQVLHRSFREADVNHYEGVEGFGGLDGPFEGVNIMLSGDHVGKPCLNTKDVVPILSTDPDRLCNIGMSQVFELADRPGDHARERDIQ